MKLVGRKVVMLIDKGYEDLEFWVPLMRLVEEGAEVVVAGEGAGRKVESKSGGMQAEIKVEAGELDADQFDGVVIPGGWAPDRMRRSRGIKNIVRSLDEAGKIVAMICHAGLVGISAGIVSGHRATGSMGIKDDLENAGAIWVDEAAFRDGNQVWGRVVADIPAFCRELVAALSE